MKTSFVAALLMALVFAVPETASARVFEPQSDWWNAGQTCVASRNPPARRWRATPARSCARAHRESAAAISAERAVADIVKIKLVAAEV